jgi:hypothetical protein
MTAGISGFPVTAVNPSVGDLVLVYSDSSLELYLKVVGRKWKLAKGVDPTLVCELHLPDYFKTIADLEKVVLHR